MLLVQLPRAEQLRVIELERPTGQVEVAYWPGGEERALRIARLLEDAPDLPGLPSGVPSRAVFYLAPDRASWDSLTGGRVPEWGAGVAIPDRGVAVIPLFGAPGGGLRARDRTALHEWAHLGLHEFLSGLRIPRWFDEGYAQQAAGGWNVQDGWRLRLGLTGDAAPPLDSLTLDWPRGRTGAQLAYLLSGSAVEFLTSQSGERGLEAFLSRWRETGDFEETFRRTFGYSTATFETQWVRHIRRRYGWVLVLSQAAVFWLLAGSALFLLAHLRRQRNLERLARLRATQPPSRPAYWEPPPTPPIGGFRPHPKRDRRG